MFVLIARMPFLSAPERYGQGLRNFLEMAHRGGVTTALDMGIGLFSIEVQRVIWIFITHVVKKMINITCFHIVDRHIRPPAKLLRTSISHLGCILTISSEMERALTNVLIDL